MPTRKAELIERCNLVNFCYTKLMCRTLNRQTFEITITFSEAVSKNLARPHASCSPFLLPAHRKPEAKKSSLAYASDNHLLCAANWTTDSVSLSLLELHLNTLLS